MKKILMAGLVAASLCSCQSEPVSLKGQSYSTTYDNGTKISLKFDPEAERVFGKVVNNYNGPYKIDGNKISFGPLASTMMMGPEDAMKAEQSYFKFMSEVTTYEVAKDGSLILKNASGKTVKFEK